MKKISIIFVGVFIINIHLNGLNVPPGEKFSYTVENPDSLPLVLPENHADLIAGKLRNEALLKFSQHRLPDNLKEWEEYRVNLKNEIIKKACVHIDHNLPLNIREFGAIHMKGYIIKNISFQTLPGVYATANLFIPDGNGPFPAVINLHAHSGRFDDQDQAVGHSLAVNGYVCLSIDPWGAGERTTVHGVTEYHGANLGASFMNIGESLMGIQISDNMRGVDLLCSLPEVDEKNIGATGASGGGNQTMWLAAVDERIKAAVPVVSVGTFESYVMRSNCICELLIDGLTFTEEAGVLALARAIMPCNHSKDENPTFYPSEMLRSYNNAKPVFKMAAKENNISCRISDLPHGFLPYDREAMLGWFDLHLKNMGTGVPEKEVPFKLLTEEELMVYPKGHRDADITTTAEYCKRKGAELRTAFLNTKSFNTVQKKKELQDILRINEKPELQQIHRYSSKNGWNRFVLETSDHKLIPVLHLVPVDKSLGYVIVCNTPGKKSIPSAIINEYKKKGNGIVLVDLTGTGEAASSMDRTSNRSYILHTLSRAELWLGKTVLGEWVKDLRVVAEFLNSEYKPMRISIDGSKEAGLAGLFMSVLNGGVESIILRDAPVSYQFDNRQSIDFFSMGIHLPGFLNWGDISLAAGLSGINVTFINPVTMSGKTIRGDISKEYQTEFDDIRRKCGHSGKAFFN
jgi:hypothetical protein